MFEYEYINLEKVKKDVYFVVNIGYFEWRIVREDMGRLIS